MANAWHHAVSSAKKWGGKPEDYLAVHKWFDSTKQSWADQRHRAVLHSTFGIALAEQVFGQIIRRKSDGKAIPVRYIGEQHVVEDCGFIPTLQDWLGELPMKEWMARGARTFVRTMQLSDTLKGVAV